MEVKLDYKQTEIGIIPGDWKVKPIGDFFSIFVGRDLKNENYSTYQDNIFRYPVYSNTVSKEGLYGYYNFPEYSGESLTIVGRGVGLGTAFKRVGGYGAIGRLLVLFPKENVNAAFVTEYINHRVKIFTESGGIPQLTGISIAKYEIPLPPTLAEQQAIAKVLSDVDIFIEALELLIAKKRAIKQGVMQELLTGKRRLPGFEGEWGKKRIVEIYQLESGKSKSKEVIKGGKYLVMDMGSVSTDGRIISEKRTNNETDLLKIGDLIMPKDDIGGGNIIGKTAYIDQNCRYVLGDHVYKLSLHNNENSSLFFSYLINSLYINRKIKKLVTGSAQLGINKSSVSSIEIIYPDSYEQKAIGKFINDLINEIESLELLKNKYKNIKQGMMQQLLTGKMRLM